MSKSKPGKDSRAEASRATMALPPETAQALRTAYQAYAAAARERSPERTETATALANIAAKGRKWGWPIQVMAEPCEITPERLRQITKKWATGDDVDVEFPDQRARKKVIRRRRRPKRAHLSVEEADRLLELSDDARKNTGSRPLDSKFRKASEEFSRLIMEHHDRGVIWREISDATREGRPGWPLPEEFLEEIRVAEETGEPDPYPPTHHVSGLRMRAARHGYNNGAPPSIKPYMRVSRHPPKDEVKSSHKEAAPSQQEKATPKRKKKAA